MDTGFETMFALSLEPGQMVANLSIALVCGFVISMTYRLTSDSLNYSPAFVRSLVILSMITALVIMVIGNNLARAFGLVGTMSIIRFRTAVKDVQDIVFIFFTLAAGMAAGIGLRGTAVVGTLLICGILILLQRMHYAHHTEHQFIVQFQSQLGEGEPPYLPIFRRLSTTARLANMRSLGTGDLFEMTFYVELKDMSGRSELMRQLNQTQSLSNIRLYFDDV